jgi:hypothetical protein
MAAFFIMTPALKAGAISSQIEGYHFQNRDYRIENVMLRRCSFAVGTVFLCAAGLQHS